MMTEKFLSDNQIPFEKDVHLAKKSWIKTGGVCALWVVPSNVDHLTKTCRYLYVHEIPFIVVGQTSNIFFHSSYEPQVVVSTIHVNNYIIRENALTADCGVSVMKLAKEFLEKGYAGFSGLTGLPGTVASAVVNNAGCFGCSISSMLISADVMMPDGTVKTFSKEDFGYEKRTSRFKRGEIKGIILSVKLRLQEAVDVDDELRKAEKAKLYRKNCQEGPAKNLGSVFAKMKRRRNLKNMLTKLISLVAGMKSIPAQRLVDKRMLLFLYGYRDLDRYISDRQINTFVWCDADAEQKFVRYKEFMGKVFDNLSIEIEERE